MGRIYRRDNTETWWGDYRDPRGRRRRESLRTTDAKVARERLRLAELVATDPAAHRQARSLAAAIGYLVDVALSGSPDGTVRFYRQKCGHLIRILGNCEVSTITKADALAFAQQRLAEGAHRHTVGKELITLRRVLLAEHDRVALPVHPRDILPKWKMEYTPRSRHLSRLEFERLLVATAPKRRVWLMVAAYAGANLGELERLQWSHVDLARGLIHLPGTKTAGRHRTVPIAEPLRPWLLGAQHRRGAVLERWANVTRDLGRSCARARLPRVTLNDLRRTFASWLVDAGVPILTVSHLLGHSSTRMVEKVYGRLNREHYASAVSKLPDCDVGVTSNGPLVARGGAIGAGSIVYNDANTNDFRVPRDGIEPPTRGFSVHSSPDGGSAESPIRTRRSAIEAAAKQPKRRAL